MNEAFQSKLVEAGGIGSQIGLAAAKVMANSGNISELNKSVLSDQLNSAIEVMRHLHTSLQRAGEQNK